MMESAIFMQHKRVSLRRARNVNHALGARSPLARFSQVLGVMAEHRLTPAALRAEARLLTVAGLILLAVGFPLTLLLVARALSADAGSPFLPLAVGAPPIMLGYLACHFASQRMVKAKAIEA
jgi:hypothetical protein